MTAIAVMLAILTIFLAAAAIWGINELKKVAKEEADVVSARNNSELSDQVRGNQGDFGKAAGSVDNE